MIDSYRTQGEWKVQLAMRINFFSSKDSEEIRTMYNPSDNIETMIGYETDEIVEDLYEKIEKSMKGSEFFYDRVDLFHYRFHRIS